VAAAFTNSEVARQYRDDILGDSVSEEVWMVPRSSGDYDVQPGAAALLGTYFGRIPLGQ